MHVRFILAICFLFLFIHSSHACFSYEPAVVQISGTITVDTFPGRPNYSSIQEGDEPEIYWILQLDNSICVNGSKDSEPNPNKVSESEVHKMQMVLDGDQYKQYGNLKGKKVVVFGSLFHMITAHHKTPVLITVNKIAPALKTAAKHSSSDKREISNGAKPRTATP